MSNENGALICLFFAVAKLDCFVKIYLNSIQEKSREKSTNIRLDTFLFCPSETSLQNALFIGILRGSKFSPHGKIFLSCDSENSLRREFLFPPVL
ncbi:Uncharacterised protein [Porphyromonas crevioricanis]|uniref:Uncharacterized protein n=1 Tax=Porphyromonas crevioricanis TaxID=393921 RepID=A0A2X4PKG3_9PORP|nr:hypothetical protein PORCAN_252 [Porphyromonas crevioricanis JCM 13913]SQH73230.1 Uncharacterised protein [Porphyromonas crevioricanis]